MEKKSEKKYIHTYVFGSFCCTSESNNIVNQLHSNKIFLKTNLVHDSLKRGKIFNNRLTNKV